MNRVRCIGFLTRHTIRPAPVWSRLLHRRYTFPQHNGAPFIRSYASRRRRRRAPPGGSEADPEGPSGSSQVEVEVHRPRVQYLHDFGEEFLAFAWERDEGEDDEEAAEEGLALNDTDIPRIKVLKDPTPLS